jgi:tetratricopeptide (TPR) repeat protein
MPGVVTSMPAMVDLREDPGGNITLSWIEAPGAHKKVVAPVEIARLRHLAEAVSLAESRELPDVIVEARTALSTALYVLLDGPERALAQRMEAAEAQRRRLDLVVRAQNADRRALREHPATWMRWELLPFAETRRRGAPPFTVVLQLGAQALAAPRILDRSGLRVLFMASSPHDAPPELDFEHEEEQMLAALAPFAERRSAHLRVVEEGTLDDLGRALLVERFDVVHLTGHGMLKPEGPRLAMEDAFGTKHLVSPAELIEVLEAAKAMPELIMLSSCHSAEVRGSVASFAAELVAAGVPNVLGWTRPVRDDVATEAAKGLYQQLATGKTLVEAAHFVREAMRRGDERAMVPSHAWGTLHLVSGAASGFRVGNGEEPLSESFDRGEVYRFLGRHMRVLETGFVGRRRPVQRLLRVLVHGKDVRSEGTRDVAGACVFGMKGVGKSCAVGRTIERAKQRAPNLGVVVLHGEIDERSVLEAFEEAASAGGDEAAERMLARADEDVLRRVRRVMELWRGRPVAIVLDDFEQNLERRSDGPWQLTPKAVALLETVLPVCLAGRPKLLVTSTADFRMPAGHERALAFVELGSLEPAAVRKLWMRGQASNELGSVTLGSWQDLAERLGRNARVLAWARALCGRKSDAELLEVAARAKAELPVWKVGDEASEEKRAELAALFLRHMAYDEARVAFGEGALAFVKRARVFDAAVPMEAFAALVEGLGVDLRRDLDALASWGLMEVGELDGARAYRVSPLVEPRLETEDAARWHEAAADAWEGLAAKAPNRAIALERTRAAWEHALKAREVVRADRLARRIDGELFRTGLYGESLRLADRHLEALPESPFGHVWTGHAEFKAGQPGPHATERVQRGLALVIRSLGTEAHPDVAAALHVLGSVLEAQGDLVGARRALEHSLDIEVKVLGTEDHLNVAASLHELGRVLAGQGDLAGARTTLQQALHIMAKVLGTDMHPDVALSLQGLAGVLELQGDLAGARRALERSLHIMTATLGTEDHPFVAAALHSLGSVLQGLGDLTGALRALERSLDIKVKALEHRSA